MQFFRNLTLLRIDSDVAADMSRLADVLPDRALRPVGPIEMLTRGFVPPIDGTDMPLLQTIDNDRFTLVAMGGEDKLLPPAVLSYALRQKLQAIEEEEGRSVRGRERKRIKEDLVTTLLAQAFVVHSRMLAYIDRKAGWLIIDTAGRKGAEALVTQIREALGSFPAIPMAPQESPRILMTGWLSGHATPAGFVLGDECELRDPSTSTGAISRSRRQDLDSEEIREHLRNGKQVYQLGLVFDDRMSFVLGEDMVIRKLKFLDVVQDTLGDAESSADLAMGTFALMALELARLLENLELVFGLAVDAPLRLHPQDPPAGMREGAAMRSAQGALTKLHNKLAKDGTSMTIEHNGKVTHIGKKTVN